MMFRGDVREWIIMSGGQPRDWHLPASTSRPASTTVGVTCAAWRCESWRCAGAVERRSRRRNRDTGGRAGPGGSSR